MLFRSLVDNTAELLARFEAEELARVMTLAHSKPIPVSQLAQHPVPQKVDALINRQKELEREISRLKSNLAAGGCDDLLKNVKDLNGVKFLTAKLVDTDINSMRDLSDNLRVKIGYSAYFRNGRGTFRGSRR